MTHSGEEKPFWELRHRSVAGEPVGTPAKLREHNVVPPNLLIPYFVPVDETLTTLPHYANTGFAESLADFEKSISEYTPPGNPVDINTIPTIKRVLKGANPGF